MMIINASLLTLPDDTMTTSTRSIAIAMKEGENHVEYEDNNSFQGNLESNENSTWCRTHALKSSLFCIFAISMFAIAIILFIVDASLSPIDNYAEVDMPIPSNYPTALPSSVVDIDLNGFLAERLGPNAACFSVGSNQWKAKRWIGNNDPLSLDPTDKKQRRNIRQHYGLLTMYYSMSDEVPLQVDWLNADECRSDRISCNDDGIVRALELGKPQHHVTFFDSVHVFVA